MAVVIDFLVPGATHEHVYSMETLTQARGQVVGGPPYTGCMFIATSAVEGGMRIVSAWRSSDDFRVVLDTMLAPDLASLGLAVSGVEVAPVVSMAIPGDHGS